MFTTCVKSSPAAARTLFRFVRVCLVCSRTSALTTSLVFGSSGPCPDTDLVTFDCAHAAVQHGVADLESLVVPLAHTGLDHDLVAEPAGREEARLGLDYRQAGNAVFLTERVPIQANRIEKEPGTLVEPLEVVGVEDDPRGIGVAPMNGDVMLIGFHCSSLRRWIIAPRFGGTRMHYNSR